MKHLLLFVLLLLITGCSGGAPQKVLSVTGTQGVVVSIIDMPSEVYENEQFPVTFQLANVGATAIDEVSPGLYSLSYDPLYLSDVDTVSKFPIPSFWLAPRTPYVDGEYAYITTYLQANPIQRYSQEIRTPILLTACYPYRSDITTQVCIEALRRADPGAVICRNTPLVPDTPGAPIGVSRVEVRTQTVPEQDGGGVQPTFRVTIKNFGQGVPSSSSCDRTVADESGFNEVFVSAFLLGEPLECGADVRREEPSVVRLIRGEATVLCQMPSDTVITRGDGNFLSLLSVNLDYTYRESAKAEVRIVR